MLIEVALTKEIINESLPIHYRHAPLKLRYLSYLIPAILVIVGVYNTITDTNTGGGWERLITPVIYLVIAVLFAIWTNYKRNNAGNQMIKSFGDRTHYEIDANEDKLITRLSDATYDQQSTVYPKAIISKELVLLYQQNNMFAMFHHSFFSNDDFSRFKQLVGNRVHQVIED